MIWRRSCEGWGHSIISNNMHVNDFAGKVLKLAAKVPKLAAKVITSVGKARRLTHDLAHYFFMTLPTNFRTLPAKFLTLPANFMTVPADAE